MEFFPDSLEELQTYLPLWWRKEDPSSELYKWLFTIAAQLDGTSQAFETAYNNAILTRADRASLIANWAWLWGLDNEQLPPTTSALLAYVQARAQEDGSLQSFIRTLVALIATPVNTTGIQLVFPGGGGGFTFPVDGSGIGPLFQSTPNFPNLIFPADGSGIGFPDQALYFAADGTGLRFPDDGTGLALPNIPDLTFGSGVTGFFDVQERTPVAYQFTVLSKSYLTFDRNAVLRAIERFRLAHLLPAIYTETNY